MNKGLIISRRFLRSVNLARDSVSGKGLEGYIVTASARQALARIGNGLSGSRTDRAFTLTGPYGSGKSSFALFLFHLLLSQDNEAWKMLREADIDLAKKFRDVAWPKKSKYGFACLVATASMRQSVPEILADAVESYAGTLPRLITSLVAQLRKARDARDAMRLVEDISKAFRKAGHCGVLFIVDEFGRVFENARIHPGETDASLLQDLAEAAARSGETGLALLGVLHQGVGDYAASDPSLRREFSKIEGRFDPIVFTETPDSQIRLIAEAINSDKRLSGSEERILKKAVQIGVPRKVGLSEEDFTKYVRMAYPLHPLALAALPVLFRRIGQNERSVFSYLAGNEPKSLSDVCSSGDFDGFVGLRDLYDYIFTNFEAHLSLHSFGQAILEANNVILSKDSLTDEERVTLKAVSLLSSLGTQCALNASQDLIALALAPMALGESLNELKLKSILVYRKFNRTFALWNGSDVDLEEAQRRADEELDKTGFSLAETLNGFMPPEPMIAKRHSFDTGTLRYFKTCYVDRPSELEACKDRKDEAAAGLLVVCLPERRSEVETFIEASMNISRNAPELLFAIPRECGDLREALKEVRRLRWIEDNVKALRDDKIASREVSVRLAEATQSVMLRQFGLLDPNPSPHGVECVFVCDGRQQEGVRSGKDLSRLISERCDRLYPESPRIRNELINRRVPSSQAASARNKLMAGLNNPERCKLPVLGIEGYPPERSIYESVILASGMHEEGSDGTWRLVRPSSEAPTNLRPAWNRLSDIVFASRDKPVAVKEIYAELRKPPYGMLEGLLTLLIISFFLVNRDEVFLYYEGTFQPEPTDAHFELLIRRPDLFALSGMRISGTRAAIVKRLAVGLGAPTETLMPVVRKLYGLRNSLSKYALETDSVSAKAKAFRKAFEDAKSPEVLLFKSLPTVFGLDGIDEVRLDKAQLERYFNSLNTCLHELGGALPKLVSECRAKLLDSFGLENDEEGWRLLFERSCTLIARLGPSDLGPFLQNVKNTDGDWNKAERVMSFMVSSPMEKWGPLQTDEFSRAVTGLAERFKAAWRPYDGTAALSAKDEKAAANLLSGIQAAAKKQKTGRTALRAALLRALAELDGTEVRS